MRAPILFVKSALLEYIQPFIEKTSTGKYRKHFENPMLDAVAAHYIDMAQSQNTRLLWNIDLINIPIIVF